MITEVSTDELVLPWMPRLLVKLANEFHRRLNGFRPAAERFHVFQVARRYGADLLDKIERDVSDAVQRWHEGNSFHLAPHRFHDTRVTMTQNRDEDASYGIEIT